MSASICRETEVFFQAVLHGIFLTVIYDLFRILRRLIRHCTAAVSAEDFVYWLTAGFLTFCFAFEKTDGIVRGYTALGIVLGSVLYHEVCSEKLVKLMVMAIALPWKLSCNAWRTHCGDEKRLGIMKKRRRRMSKGNRLGMVLISFIVVVLLIVLLVQSQRLREQNAVYEAEKAELEQQIRDEEIRAEEIEKLEEYVDSTEYIEKVAREKLGLVYEDEVIYVPEE